MEVKRLKQLYTLFISALPMISVYASGIPGFTLGDILLALFFVLRIIQAVVERKLWIKRCVAPVIPLIVTIPVVTLLSMLFHQNIDIYSIFIRIIRRLFYYVCVVIVSGDWFEHELGKKCFIFWGIAGAVYLFIQYVAYYAGHIILHGYLPFLPVYHESYMQVDYQTMFGFMFRPTSFLLEPAHISRYFTIPLTILLFANESKWRWLSAFAVSAAVLATTSGVGIISIALIWFLWIVFGKEGEEKKRPTIYLAIYLTIIVGLVIAINNRVVQGALLRITSSDLLNINTAGGARFKGYVQFGRLDFWGKVFGMGYGSTPDTAYVTWFSGASYMLYGTGFLGFSVSIIMFVKLFFRNSSILSRVLVVVFILLFFVDDSFMNNVAVVFFSTICSIPSQKRILQKA